MPETAGEFFGLTLYTRIIAPRSRASSFDRSHFITVRLYCSPIVSEITSSLRSSIKVYRIVAYAACSAVKSSNLY